MDKKALLEQFKAEVESSNTSLAHIMKICHFDENCNDFGSDTVHDYSIGCLNGAWCAFQHQQAKVEELEKEWFEMNQQHEQAVKECFEVNSENRKLQKRVDKAIEAINEYYDSDGMSGLYFMDLKEILEGE